MIAPLLRRLGGFLPCTWVQDERRHGLLSFIDFRPAVGIVRQQFGCSYLKCYKFFQEPAKYLDLDIHPGAVTGRNGVVTRRGYAAAIRVVGVSRKINGSVPHR